MSDTTGRRRNIPSDPTAERTSDPVPTGEDIIEREQSGETPTRSDDREAETPRRYEQPLEQDPELPAVTSPEDSERTRR
jgi:hypothetical protein